MPAAVAYQRAAAPEMPPPTMTRSHGLESLRRLLLRLAVDVVVALP